MDRTVLKIRIKESLYIRDPQETELGKRILSEGIRMIDDLGMEKFTFKKLAEKIDSTEASIYRYFENKHKFLLYLTSWFWIWMDFQVQFAIQNIVEPKEKLIAIINSIVHSRHHATSSEVDELILHRIIITESPKSYLLKEVEEFNSEGNYREFKKFCARISETILQLNPNYLYANSLASSLVEMAYQQQYFALHLPSLSSLKANDKDGTELFLQHVIFGLIELK
jgi:AcrR family transcriptional regulator